MKFLPFSYLFYVLHVFQHECFFNSFYQFYEFSVNYTNYYLILTCFNILRYFKHYILFTLYVFSFICHQFLLVFLFNMNFHTSFSFNYYFLFFIVHSNERAPVEEDKLLKQWLKNMHGSFNTNFGYGVRILQSSIKNNKNNSDSDVFVLGFLCFRILTSFLFFI